MPGSKAPGPVEPRVARLLEAFSVEPGDRSAFERLRSILSDQEDWGRLAGVYECRLSVVESGEPERTKLLISLGELLETRLRDLRGARRRYEEAFHETSADPEPLRCLRRLHTRMGDFSAALQVAEVEVKLDRPAEERASLLVEVAALWHSIGDPGEARRALDQALQLDPRCGPALEALAELEQAEGRLDAALGLLDRRAAGLEAAERARLLDRMASMILDEDPERGVALLRESARLDPSRTGTLERLLPLEEERANWAGAEEVCLALWKLREGNARRAGLALRAAETQLEAAGRIDAAIRWADRALEVAPNDPAVHSLRARVFRKAARSRERIDALERLFELGGPVADLVLELATLQEQEGNPQGSLRWIRHHLAQHPEDTRALGALDRCLCAVGEHGERVDVLERRAILAPTPGERGRLLTQAARLCEEHLQDGAKAERLYRCAVSENADVREAVEGLARLLRAHGKNTELARLFEELAIGPAPAPVRARWWTRVGSVRLELLEDPTAAAEAYRRALELQPATRGGLEGLRQVARTLGDPALRLEAAERELARALDGPGLGSTLREGVEAALAAGSLPRAFELARRWVEGEPCPEALEALMGCARASGDEDEERRAILMLESHLGADPVRHAACLIRLAEMEMARPDAGAARQAASWLEQALRLRPDAETRGRLCEVYERSGRWSDLARVLRERLSEVSPEEAAPARMELGRVLEQAGDREEAARVLREAWNLAPHLPGVADALEAILADLGRPEEVARLLQERLSRESDPEEAQLLAIRATELLLDQLGRPAEAAALLHDRVRPARMGRAEALYTRALEASGNAEGLIRWLDARARNCDGPERVEMRLRQAVVEEETGNIEGTLVTLVHAACEASGSLRDHVRRCLRATLEKRAPEEELSFLDRLLQEEIDSVARQELRLDRAAVLAERFDRIEEAAEELERARREGPLPAPTLNFLAGLYRRLGKNEERLPVLEQLADATRDPAQRRRALLERADLLSSGPPTIRDPSTAESLLRELLGDGVEDEGAFRRLVRLLEETEQHRAMAELLERRLHAPGLDTARCRSITLKLAALEPVRRAAKRLYDLRAQLGPDPAVDHALADALRATGRTDAEARLARECALRAQLGGPEREGWLRRWLEALDQAGLAPEAHLEQLEGWLENCPNEPLILRERLRLVRRTGAASAIVDAIERCLEQPGALAEGTRREAIRELALLADAVPHRLDDLLRRLCAELERDPALASPMAGLAMRLPDPRRQLEILLPLLSEPPAGFQPLPSHRRALGLALFHRGRTEEAEPMLRAAAEADLGDLEVVRACEELAHRRGDTEESQRWMEVRFAVEEPSRRTEVARQGLALAQAAGDDASALRWLRKWDALEPLPPQWIEPWLELEGAFGTPATELRALRTVRERTHDDACRNRMLLRAATLLQETGERELARGAFREAVDASPDPEPALLEAWEKLLREPSEARERIDVLERLAHHPRLSPQEQKRHAATRVDLLARDPERVADATAELRRLFSDPGTPEAERIAWGRRLLSLCRETQREEEWCSVAEQLIPLLPDSEGRALERALARRLADTLGARERAIARWRDMLERDPSDQEALRSQADLLCVPGSEGERAGVLERLAACGVEDAPSLLLEAATIRWKTLADAEATCRDLETVLEACPDLLAAHELRVEAAARLGRPRWVAESLRALLAHDEENPSAERWIRLAGLLATGAGTREGAQAAAVRGLQLTTAASEDHRRLRQVLETIEDWDRVAELLRQESAVAPAEERIPLLRQLARVEWSHLANAERACQAFEELRAIDALSATECALFAEALEELGRWAEVLDLRADMLRLMGGAVPAEVWRELATAYLARTDDVDRAAAACDAALGVDPGSIDALRLRADLDARRADPEGEAMRREELARRLVNPGEAAVELARAATLHRSPLGQPEAAARLFVAALERDPGCLPALVGAGELAFERGRFEEAERCLDQAARLLPGTPMENRRTEIASLAARAAAELGRDECALAHLEAVLAESLDDPAVLDLGATVALRLSAWQRARELLEARLALDGLDERARAERLIRLARAAEALGDRPAAAGALEEAVRLRPEDEALRARLVDLLDELDEHGRLIEQLDAWVQSSAPADAVPLAIRAARLELKQGDGGRARTRLEEILASAPDSAEAWRELSALHMSEGEAELALTRANEGIAQLGEAPERAPLLGIKARALDALGRAAEAADAALGALETNPNDAFSASCLAANVGRTSDWRRAAWALEHALDVAQLPTIVQAEIWDAVGRLYAGPLQDLERAERAYRRALSRNPDLDHARESLADVTSFDPDGHTESLELHAALLERFPARRASWKALERIATHWKRSDSLAACRWVLCALERTEPDASSASPALMGSLFPSPEVETATVLVRALEETGEPVAQDAAAETPIPTPVADILDELAGPLARLRDDEFSSTLERAIALQNTTDRRVRRKVREALRRSPEEDVRALAPETCKADLLAIAVARAAGRGQLGPRKALEVLFAGWPSTAKLELGVSGDLAEASQLCPPLRSLLLRIAEGARAGLGLS